MEKYIGTIRKAGPADRKSMYILLPAELRQDHPWVEELGRHVKIHVEGRKLIIEPLTL